MYFYCLISKSNCMQNKQTVAQKGHIFLCFYFLKAFVKAVWKEKIVGQKYIFVMFTKILKLIMKSVKILLSKFLILHVCKRKTLRSRISRPIILHVISIWLMNVLLRITRVVMRLLRKSHFFFFQKPKTSQETDLFG